MKQQNVQNGNGVQQDQNAGNTNVNQQGNGVLYKERQQPQRVNPTKAYPPIPPDAPDFLVNGNGQGTEVHPEPVGYNQQTAVPAGSLQQETGFPESPDAFGESADTLQAQVGDQNVQAPEPVTVKTEGQNEVTQVDVSPKPENQTLVEAMSTGIAAHNHADNIQPDGGYQSSQAPEPVTDNMAVQQANVSPQPENQPQGDAMPIDNAPQNQADIIQPDEDGQVPEPAAETSNSVSEEDALSEISEKIASGYFKKDVDLEYSLKLINRGIIGINLKDKNARMDYARHALHIGASLNALRKEVMGGKQSWQKYAEENIHGIGERTQQNFMLCAKIQGAVNHIDLGISGIHIAVRAIINKDSDYMFADDPIEAFRKKHGIYFNENFSYKALKLMVNVAKAMDEAERAGIPVEGGEDVSGGTPLKREHVEAVISQNGVIDFKELAKISDADGNPNYPLKQQTIIGVKKGRRSAKPMKFSRAFNDMKKVVTRLNEADFLDDETVKTNKIDQLIVDLQQLRNNVLDQY